MVIIFYYFIAIALKLENAGTDLIVIGQMELVNSMMCFVLGLQLNAIKELESVEYLSGITLNII